MVTWLDGRMIGSFFFIFIFVFCVPFCLPAVDLDLGLTGNVVSLHVLGMPREWVLNNIVLSVLPTDVAVSLAQWWMQTNYAGEVMLHVFIALNLFIPFALVWFWCLDGYMRVTNWYYLRKFEVGVKTSKSA